MPLFDHPRTDWQDPLHPVHGLAFLPANLLLFDTSLIPRYPGLVIHYGGVPDVPDGDPDELWAQIPAFLRSIDYFHRTAKGYSFAYNSALDQRGELWEARGVDYRNAANKSHWHNPLKPETNQNLYTLSVLCLVDGADKLSSLATARLRAFVRDMRVLSRPDLPYRGHNFYDDTACPCAGIRDQIQMGWFEPAPEPSPIPIPDPIPTPSPDPTPTPIPIFEDIIMWNVSKTVPSGPSYAWPSPNGLAYHVPTQIAAEEVFKVGGGFALDWSSGQGRVIPVGSWAASVGTLTKDQLLAKHDLTLA